ncbi:related to DUF985 domain [Lecanosticta acicola]|uniref:Related to DUF985 domain n=1 Tax=Lecanosticta acicola TaxID=111012 RepID=A0AAI9ECG2_9PEZI|nr:related to DUF985 domain [Lecanosticta acicola]
MGSHQASTVDPSIPPLKPYFDVSGSHDESAELKAVMQKLKLQPHPEGGYFVETDRDAFKIPNPFPKTEKNATSTTELETRNASTTIFYLLTPKSNLGHFHRNQARTVHTLHRGRGRYVLIHADEAASPDYVGGYGGDENSPESSRWIRKARMETFVVGQNVSKGERLQWIVPGGKYKCSYLLPDKEGGDSSEGLLISETVVPGFEMTDHDFLKEDRFRILLTEEQVHETSWMLRKAA